jgi:hypothetical protein
VKIEERSTKWYEGDSRVSGTPVEWNADSNPHLKSTLTVERPKSTPDIKRVQRVRVYNHDH